jgi:carboxymethylenebutenolidase
MLQEELDSLTPSRDFSRRDFVRTSVGTGFAAAVLPVMAQTVIKTDTTGLVAGEVTIPVGDFKMPAYRAAPAGQDNLPVVLVVSEIFGVHEHIADVARRFAKAGYLAIAPELFVRQGDAGSYGEIAKLIAEVVSQGARRPGDGRPGRLRGLGQGPGRGHRPHWAVTGFCWGGRITWLYAAHNPAVKAGVAWYGRLVGRSRR